MPADAPTPPVAPTSAVAPATLQPSVAPAPVVVWNREITTFRAPLEGASPAARAAGAAERILEIPHGLGEYRIEPRPATLGDQRGVLVMVNGWGVFALLEEDVDAESGETFATVTARTVQNLRAWLEDRNQQMRPMTVLLGLVWSLVTTVVAALLLVLTLRLTKRLLRRIESAAADTSKTLKVGKADVWPYLMASWAGLIRMLAWGLGIVLAYFWLTVVLGQFPYTRPWSLQLGGFVVNVLREQGQNVLGAIPNLFIVFVIFMITRLVTRIATAFFGTAEVQWMHPEVARATRRLVVALIWVFALIVAYPYLPGSGTAAFQGISVFVGLMVSLGSSGIVSQLLGGLVIVYTRAFSVGEYVRIGEHEGTVTEIGALAAKVLTPRKEEVTIPYSVLVGTTTTNYSRHAHDAGAVVATSVTIGYDAPWRQVHAMLLEAARRTSKILREPAPRVMQRSLSDFYVEYLLLVNISQPHERYIVLSELHGHIQDQFNEHGVQIMSPHFEGQPEGRVVVPRSKWFETPATPEESRERRS